MTIRAVSPGVFVALLMIAGLVPLSTPASAPPPDAPWLRVETDFPTYHTKDLVAITFTARELVNESGNWTLRPYTDWVNVSIYDSTNDVLLGPDAVLLWNGTAVLELRVEPEWSTSTINVSAYDHARGLSATTQFRTDYSMKYVLWYVQHGILDPELAAIREDYGRQLVVSTVLILGFGATFVLLVVVFCLRVDQLRSEEFGVESYWERFTIRMWPFAMIPTPDPLLRYTDDPDELWDKFAWSRQQGAYARWRKLHDEVEANFKRVLPPPPPELSAPRGRRVDAPEGST